MQANYRTLWISDVHLGTPECRAADLLEFLDTVRAEQIYLVGDIVDLPRMRGRMRFPPAHRAVIGRLTKLAAGGTELIYITGNHDHEARDFIDREVLGVKIRHDAAHTTRSGLRLLVTHGDRFDGEIREGSDLEAFGAAAYRLLVHLDVAVSQLRDRMGRNYLPVSQRIKSRIASANKYIARFETVATRHARSAGYDGIVCGHVHTPAMRFVDGVLYANVGDWVEHRTALAETPDGQLRLLTFAGTEPGFDTAYPEYENRPVEAAA